MPQLCSKCASMGSWHGCQKAYLGLDMLPRLLSVCVFQMPVFTGTPTSAGGKAAHRGVSTSTSFLYITFVPISQASQGFVVQLMIYSKDYILGIQEKITNRFLL